MRTRTIALLIATLLVLGMSVAAFAQPRGDPPRGDVSTLATTTEQCTPRAPVREHQPVHHPEVMNDRARDRVGDHTATCTPDRDRDRAHDQDRENTSRPVHGWVEHSGKGAPHRHHDTN